MSLIPKYFVFPTSVVLPFALTAEQMKLATATSLLYWEKILQTQPRYSK